MARWGSGRGFNVILGLGSILCLALALSRQFDQWPAFLQVGYHDRAEARLDAGDTRGALDLLNRASLLDEEALERLNGVSLSGPLVTDRARDAALRARIAERLIGELGSGRSLSDEQRTWLEPATENAERLVALQPGAAQAHLLLGLVYLQRGYDSGAPIEFQRAARELGIALKINPESRRAAAALQLATSRVRALLGGAPDARGAGLSA
jgi:tetratricopeptide (TPR) repeat protein